MINYSDWRSNQTFSLLLIDLLAFAASIDDLGLIGFSVGHCIKGVTLVSTSIVHIMNGGHGFRSDESVG